MKIYKVIALTLVLAFSLAQTNASSLAETRGTLRPKSIAERNGCKSTTKGSNLEM